MVFMMDIIFQKARNNFIIGSLSHYSISKLELKLQQDAHSLCIKNAGETTAEKLSWSEQMTKVCILHCLSSPVSYKLQLKRQTIHQRE